MNIEELIRRVFTWFCAADVEDARPLEEPASVFVKPGPVVDQFVAMETGSPHEGQAVFIADEGTITIQNRIRAACGRRIAAVHAICAYCKKPECGADHFFNCSRCGAGLCLLCVVKFPAGGQPGDFLPLCPRHGEIARQTGSPEADW